jgi:hypothetical protein
MARLSVVMAWQDLCIHRGARLSLGWVSIDKLVCQYHGWEYDVNGVCVRIPAHPDQKPPIKARVKHIGLSRGTAIYGYRLGCILFHGSGNAFIFVLQLELINIQ